MKKIVVAFIGFFISFPFIVKIQERKDESGKKGIYCRHAFQNQQI
jgi:hypothetical protein